MLQKNRRVAEHDKGGTMYKVAGMRGVWAAVAILCALSVCSAQELVPPLPIPILLGTPVVVPENLLQSEVHSLSPHGCDGVATAEHFRVPLGTLQDILGGAKVKEIQIVRVTPTQASTPSVTGVYTPPAVLAIKRALRRRIQDGGCTLSWAEPVGWTVQADIQFEDGIKRKLFTNGTYVAAQDRTGRTWFLRLV